MWRNFKSWWYWKVSSKYDGADISIFVVMPLLMLFMTVVAIMDDNKFRDYVAECGQRGGYVVKASGGYVCLDKKVIL